MKDLEKVNASQLFGFWKNFSVGLLVMIVTLFLSRLFPSYFSPIIGLFAAAFLYTRLYNNRLSSSSICMVISYAMFYCMIIYSFTSIVLNVLDIWSLIKIPKELSFFNEPYMPSLILDPICFITLVIFQLRGSKLSICIDCKLSKGLSIERGKLGEILSHESRLQLRNMVWLFGVLSCIVWIYYIFFFYDYALVNNRDWYVIVWINIIAIVLDELYFASRYYNIYLDLKENGEIITEQELSNMTTKTYLRFYLVCGNKVFMNTRVADRHNAGRFYIDTPFLTKRNVNGITTAEVRGIIQRFTGIRDGELRFFYGRKSLDIAKHHVLRYFYFLNGNTEDYSNLDVDGEWMDFEAMKVIYNTRPEMMSMTLLTDISRMVTIVLTQKLFDERGYRLMKIKSYQPSFDLVEVRKKNYDFQDDKWILVSMYNSDVRSFQIRRWWNKFFRRDSNKNKREWQRNQ